MEIYGWALFGDLQRSESAKVALEAERYRVEVQPQEDGAVVLLAIPENSLTPDALATKLRSVADEFGGEFMGHGGSEQIVLRRHS